MNMKSGTYKVEVNPNNEYWYDANGNKIHYKTSNGFEEWYDSDGNLIFK